MTEERFLEHLGRQADDERERIAEAAAEEARRIRDAGTARADRERQEILKKAQRRASALRSRILNEARLEAARTTLEARHGVVDGILKRIAERLSDLDDAGISLLLRECAFTEGATVFCRAADRDRVASAAETMGCAGVHIDDSIQLGGVVVSSADGRFIERNTMEERLARVRPRLMQEIYDTFFLSPGEGRSERRGR